ncbi:hypothetical protein GY24_04570 [Microterricola pindariensis]|uniref:Bacterial Ig-like domain-containing protein n=2 Tax=Microterricola pindariensis TaxID=478010 RepID=A0ABX5AXY1_9MICO|nr:hypothetical protein GY24_04570 [Microterricola pindariensis]
MRSLPRRLRTGVAGVAVLSVTLLGLTAVPAQAEGLLAEGMLLDVADVAPMAVVTDRLPVVDSQAGWGSALGTDPLVRVGLRGSADGHAAVLLRVTLPQAASDTVLSTGDPAAPSTVLSAAAGQAASTTVLLPVTNDSVALWASVTAEVRIETVAAFDGAAAVPGSTIALPTPVRRADTAVGLGGPLLTAGDTRLIGVTGEGGVASELVRAVYASVTVELSEPTDLTVNGLRLPLPGGPSTITSVFTPDEKGLIALGLAAGSGSLQLDVLGWMPEADTDFEQANVVGSFVHSTERTTAQQLRVAASGTRADRPVDTADTTDSSYSLVLLSAEPGAQLALLGFGPQQGRASGVAVDPAAGALPQLAIAPTIDSTSSLALSRGAVDATVIALGDFLHDAPRRGDAEPSVTITAPLTQSAIDLGENGAFLLEGTLDTPGAALDRVEISSPGAGLIGTAEFATGSDGTVSWSFEASAPDDGEFEYIATVFDRSGASSSDSVHIDITAADADDVVISMNTVLVNGAGQPVMRGVSAHSVSFEELPDFDTNDVLVSDVTDTLPDGFFERVVSANRVGDLWVVSTVPASLEAVFYQADIDEQLVLEDPAGITRSDDTSPPTGDDVTFTDIDNGDEGAFIATGDDVDLAPYPDPAAPAPAQLAAPSAAVMMAFAFKPALLVKWSSGAPDVTNLTDAGADARAAAAAEVEASAVDEELSLSALVEADTQVAVTLTMVLDITMRWKWKVIPASVDVNEFTVKATTKVKAEVSFKASVEWERNVNLTKDLVGFTLPSIRFMAGPVPVVITNKLTLGLMVDLKLSATVTVPMFGYTREETNGFSYTKANGLTRVHEGPGGSFKPLTFDGMPGTTSADFEGTLAVGPRIKLDSKMYGVFGPNVSAGAQLGVTGAVHRPDISKPEVSGSVEMYARAAIEARAELKILRWTLLDVKLADKAFTYSLWKTTFG